VRIGIEIGWINESVRSDGSNPALECAIVFDFAFVAKGCSKKVIGFHVCVFFVEYNLNPISRREKRKMSNYTLVRSVLEVIGKEVEEYKAEIERLRRRVKELERTSNDDICRKVFAEHKAQESVPPPILIPEVPQPKPVKVVKSVPVKVRVVGMVEPVKVEPVKVEPVKVVADNKRTEYQKRYQQAYREKKRKEKGVVKAQ
jgi:hypothetical protein